MSPPRKILLYTHALSGGGAERVWASLASGLARRGHRIMLAVDFEATQNQLFLDPGVELIVLGGWHLASTLRLARLMLRRRPDATLSALAVSNLKHFIAVALTRRRKRAILSYHGYSDSEPQRLSQVGFRLASVMTRLTAATVAVSDGLRSHLIDVWRASPGQTRRIYNPVEAGPVAAPRDAADLAARSPVILAAGRLVDYKNFPLLVRAFARLDRPDARLVILGDGPERPAIEAEVARLGLAERVDLPGYVERPWTYYAGARCYALSSDFEAFGLVIVEALAHGLPVVATDGDGPREILDNGRYGRLTPPGDEAALARALDATLCDPGDPAPRTARAALFSAEAGVARYQDLIEDVIAGRLAGPGAHAGHARN